MVLRAIGLLQFQLTTSPLQPQFHQGTLIIVQYFQVEQPNAGGKELTVNLVTVQLAIRLLQFQLMFHTSTNPDQLAPF